MRISTPHLLALTAVCSLLTLSANAAPPHGRGPALGALPPRLGALVRQRLANLDSNNDGKISLEEFLAPRLDRLDDMLAHLDKNGDGQLSEAEAHPATATGPDAETIDARFAKADTNGDGKLSLAELSAAVTARATARFQHLDKDSDGFLTAADRKANQAERSALAQSLRARVKAQR